MMAYMMHKTMAATSASRAAAVMGMGIMSAMVARERLTKPTQTFFASGSPLDGAPKKDW